MLFARSAALPVRTCWAQSIRSYAAPPLRPVIAHHKDTVPTLLARVQSGDKVKLRDYEPQVKLGRFSYDLKVVDGKVQPAPGRHFIGPNGCSLREPLSPTFQEVVRNFRGHSIKVFVLEEGTKLPPTLTIIHEHSDHYSLQCTEPMTLDALNSEITKFINSNAKVLTKAEFVAEYPFAI